MLVKFCMSAGTVWKIIDGFDALPDLHTAIEKSELEREGYVRRPELASGATVIKKLVSDDDGSNIYPYPIVDSPLPTSNYQAAI